MSPNWKSSDQVLDIRDPGPLSIRKLNKIDGKYRSQVVKNAVRNFGKIQFTIFEKYSMDFCDGQKRGEEELRNLRVGYKLTNSFGHKSSSEFLV